MNQHDRLTLSQQRSYLRQLENAVNKYHGTKGWASVANEIRQVKRLIQILEKGMPQEACETCKYYEPREDLYSDGRCRRHPPQPFVSTRWDTNDAASDVVCHFEFPMMSRKDWCGEWATKGESDEKTS